MSRTSLRILSMNVENLFTPGVVFYGDRVYSEADYGAKVGSLAGRIAEARVQVAALIEVGEDGGRALSDLAAAVAKVEPAGWPGFVHRFLGEPGDGGALSHKRGGMRLPFP